MGSFGTIVVFRSFVTWTLFPKNTLKTPKFGINMKDKSEQCFGLETLGWDEQWRLFVLLLSLYLSTSLSISSPAAPWSRFLLKLGFHVGDMEP